MRTMTTDDILGGVKGNLKYEAVSTYDANLENLINSVLSAFNDYTGRSFGAIESFETTKRLNGISDSIVLGFSPIITLTDFRALDDTEDYIVGEDYYIDNASGIIYIPNGLDADVYYLKGTYGDSSIPESIGLAVMEQVTFLWQKRDSLGKRSVSIGASGQGGGITYDEKLTILDLCREIIDNYRL